LKVYSDPEIFETSDDEFLDNESLNLDTCYETLTQEAFYMYRFKTQKCPIVAIKHEFNECLYYHSEKDFWRSPDKVWYFPEPCTNGQCSLASDCDMSHNIFERLYHPLWYKQSPCDKLASQFG